MDKGLSHAKQIEVEVVDVGVRARTILNKFVTFFYFVYGVISCFWLCDF